MDAKEELILQLQDHITDHENTIRILRSKLDSQSTLLNQLQQTTLESVTSERKRHMSKEVKDKYTFYHQHKNDTDILTELKAIIPHGSKIPWQWIKCYTDRKYEEESVCATLKTKKRNIKDA